MVLYSNALLELKKSYMLVIEKFHSNQHILDVSWTVVKSFFVGVGTTNNSNQADNFIEKLKKEKVVVRYR